MKSLLLITFSFLSVSVFAQEIQPESFKKYRSAYGVMGNHRALGIQGEYKFVRDFGFKVLGAKVLGYEKANDYGYAVISLITYYIPSKIKYIEPVLGLGGMYTLYHWNVSRKSGDIHDITFGGGFGLNFRFNDYFRTGINLFLANNYTSSYRQGYLKKTGRELLVLPTLTLEYLF